MSRWRILTALALIVLPFLALMGFGSYFLWQRGWSLIFWLPMVLLISLGYGLALYWHRQKKLLRLPDSVPPRHWTESDRAAWKLVQARAEGVGRLSWDQLTTFQFYVDTARDMALELARFYHPSVQDPVGSVTLPELLAVIELASHDLAALVDDYLPGGHLLTIDHWRRAPQIADWYQKASNIYWLVSALFSPLNTGLRYVSSQFAMTQPLEMLQQDLVAWFYTAFIHRLGNYLIDLHSGRLRVGARRYRELQGTPLDGASAKTMHGASTLDEPVRRVALTVMGQVKAGKSSLINALLGERRAHTDVLPATAEMTQYELQAPGIPARLVLYDTVGYGHTGPREDQLRATEEAARHSDLLVLVMHARNPARQADAELLQKLRAWFAERPELRMPPILGVLTHIDLLSPSLEWKPPYHWQAPTRPKEQQIHEAWDAAREQVGAGLVGLVPVCAAEGKVYGVEEWLLPTLVELFDDAHAIAFLRCLRAEASTGKVRKVLSQLLHAGRHIAHVLWLRSRRANETPTEAMHHSEEPG